MTDRLPVPDVRAALAATVFGAVEADVLESVAAQALVERYEVPTLLNAAGTPLQRLRLVLQGNIALTMRHPSGREVVVSDISTGGWATWIPCLTQSIPEHDFYSGAHSVFLALPAAAVRTICEKNPALYPLILADVGRRMRLLMAWTGQSVLLQPEQRMAMLIGLLARDQKLQGNSGAIQVTQQRLAALARCSRQSANGLLSALEKKGLIALAYGKCEIPDLAHLHAFAQASDDNDVG
jgi:CRP-like cAMP-binding protein